MFLKILAATMAAPIYGTQLALGLMTAVPLAATTIIYGALLNTVDESRNERHVDNSWQAQKK